MHFIIVNISLLRVAYFTKSYLICSEGQWCTAAATGTLQNVCDHFAVIVEQKLSRKIGTGAVDTVATVA